MQIDSAKARPFRLTDTPFNLVRAMYHDAAAQTRARLPMLDWPPDLFCHPAAMADDPPSR